MFYLRTANWRVTVIDWQVLLTGGIKWAIPIVDDVIITLWVLHILNSSMDGQNPYIRVLGVVCNLIKEHKVAFVVPLCEEPGSMHVESEWGAGVSIVGSLKVLH